MNKLISSSLVAIIFISANAAFADNYRHQTNNQQQYNERNRIHQGIKSGSLTREEAKGLAQEQKQIRTEERAYKASGRYTAAERKDVHQDLQQANQHIYQEKHDSQRAPR